MQTKIPGGVFVGLVMYTQFCEGCATRRRSTFVQCVEVKLKVGFDRLHASIRSRSLNFLLHFFFFLEGGVRGTQECVIPDVTRQTLRNITNRRRAGRCGSMLVVFFRVGRCLCVYVFEESRLHM